MIPAKMPQVRKNIEKSGQHLFGVFGPTKNECFMYTVGNANAGLPELLCIGSFDPQVIGAMLNQMGDMQRRAGKAFEEGFVDIDWTIPVKVRKASGDVNERFTIQAGQYLGHENYTVLQVMICDWQGKYPGDEGVTPYFDVEQP